MASSAEIILNSFLGIAGGQWTGVGIADLLRMLVEPQATAAGTSGTSSTAAGGGGVAEALGQVVSSVFGGSAVGALAATGASGSSGSSTLGKVVSAVFGNALGMVPLAKAIIGLFTGGSQEAPPPLERYALPPSLQFEAADGAGPGILGADYGQNGLARAQVPEPVGAPGTYDAGAVETTGGNTGGTTLVTVQVNAMDSRSFLDHKEEIARAVREAMLNMHSLNDVVSDL
jgi:hypothetical protein